MTRTALLAALLGVATPAWPCSVVGPLPSPAELVDRTTVIVRARASGLSSEPGRAGILGGASTQVEFEVLEVLKGAVNSGTLRFNGTVSDADDLNDRPIPYSFVRPGGRRGNCFAFNYRPGAEYLLLLRAGDHPSFAQPAQLTPYWAPLSPRNEQIPNGAGDRWLAWVRQRLPARLGA